MCNATDLRGCGILVTRPQRQSGNLRRLIEQAGGKAVVVPTIEIVDPEDQTQLRDIGLRLDSFDTAIFISANAADKGLAWLEKNNISWPSSLQVAAVGASTANALAALGCKVTITPAEKYDSEGLLAHPSMQRMQGKKVIIFRGHGGRELLASTLKERGASVEYAEVYIRRKPSISLAQQLSDVERKQISVIVTTSNEGLENLVAITDPDLMDWLLTTSLIVFSERGKQRAEQLGFRGYVAVVPQASDEAIIDTIKRIIEH